ncbi:sigma-E processing peptidase SpoIIGA [Ruminococcus albus]|uniref:Stage II sporulation protein GA (Sporulation sigma-E factor processing peptidase) n=1 Tax=Ruminococcus albus TaxID=1264 RepID=A0A1I1NF97_RUMAL|nr:sigma-E processing peptidase SpoIIGA [Ruminococcus albus]SFC94138.1 stage II sporulation protein GA (sporulation sigma-E factor processing peptidase) [Ruminococcus albus]
MKIYADVLIVTSCLVEYVYLHTAAALMHRKLRGSRVFAACLLGGLMSLLICADGDTFIGALVITIAKALGIVLTLIIAMKLRSVVDFVRSLAVFMAVRMVYTGLIIIYWEISDTKRIYVRNFTAYFDISLLKLAAALITAYVLLTVAETVKRRVFAKNVCYEALFRCGDYEVTLPAVADTGNRLCDSFTGLPVVIFCCDDMYRHYALDDPTNGMCAGFRLTPYSTINGSGLLHVTSKGNVTITDDSGESCVVRCCVGIKPADNDRSRAIFDPALLE